MPPGGSSGNVGGAKSLPAQAASQIKALRDSQHSGEASGSGSTDPVLKRLSSALGAGMSSIFVRGLQRVKRVKQPGEGKKGDEPEATANSARPDRSSQRLRRGRAALDAHRR